MVHALGPVTLKHLHGAITVLRNGHYVALCTEEGCNWEAPETDNIIVADKQLLHHHQTEH